MYSLPSRIKPILLFVFCAFIGSKGVAQCNNWSISAQLVTASTCASNGTFAVTLSGPDVANLTNIQYGIPITNGYSVALNNSPNFSSIPPGTFTVSAVANCGGTQVGRNTTITVPGNYQPPYWGYSYSKASFSCMPTGTLTLSVQKGLAPYTFHLTGWPAGYAGPTTMSTTLSSVTFDNMPAGNYSYYCTDACGSSTNPTSYYITSLAPSNMPLTFFPNDVITCDTLKIGAPHLDASGNGSPWDAYASDTSIKYSVKISNNAFNPTPYAPINYASGQAVKMNPGFSVKNCSGATLTYTFHPPCGPDWQMTTTVPVPIVQVGIQQTCNTFDASISASMLCSPITYSYTNASGTVFGPFLTNNASVSFNGLPAGSYSITFTSGDGATASTVFSSVPIPPSPYSVSVANGAVGFNNYIDYFKFTASVNIKGRRIELFSGPPGYSYNDAWYDYQYPQKYVVNNQTPVFPGTDLFPAGNYIWKITDSCGSYFLPITVGPQDLYQYTAGIDHQKQTCQGLWIWPKGTATNNGTPQPVHFVVYRNGTEYYVNNTWPHYSVGDSILISLPGDYALVPFSTYPSEENWEFFPGPNAYATPYTFTYTVNPVQVDMNFTQGFVCNAAAIGSAKIYAQGKNGMPFTNYSGHYQYYLALAGNGVTGPYIANNTTGIFTNFGGSANNFYDLKVVDSCGAFAVQQIKILDLSVTRLASASQYVTCQAGTVQLSAIYLPGATYSWTGPNGFTSNLQQPVITNATALNTGVYYVTITTPSCGQPVTDSTILVLNANPPVPQFTINCGPPITLNVSNPVPGYKYSWVFEYYLFPYQVTMPSDSANSLHPIAFGTYWPVAIDTLSGCTTIGPDSFVHQQGRPITIYSPHLQICPNDSTILVATANYLSYQWYKDGVLIPGATSQIFIASSAGVYKVVATSNVCKSVTASVTVSVTAPPTVNLTGNSQVCTGTNVLLQTPAGTGNLYTWSQNGSTIPGVNGNTYNATQPGVYQVTVTNGGCAAVSLPFTVIYHDNPTVALSPSTNQIKCIGDSVHFYTPPCFGCTYAWTFNNAPIPGASSNLYIAGAAGNYSVTVSNPPCPSVTSPAVNLIIRPSAPTAAITGATHDICSNSSVLLQTNADPTYSYVWKNNGVVITGATQSTYNANATGNYTVTVSNGGCEVTSAPFSLTVHPAPVASITPALTAELCPGQFVAFSTPFDSAFTYMWMKNGTGIPSSNAHSFTTTDSGIYYVIVSAAFCPSDTSDTVRVIVLPTAAHLPNDTVICDENSFSMTLTPGPGFFSYLWSTGAPTEHTTVTTPGLYWVTATNRCGSFTDSITIHSLSEYLPNLPADTIVCNQNNEATLTVGSLYNSIHWSTGATSPSITVTQAGTYWVKVETPCGTIYDTTTVAFCAPVVDYMNLPQQAICEGDCIAPTAQVSQFPLTYQWYFPGGNPASANTAAPGTICYANAGVYPIKLVVTNVSGSDSMTMQVTVNSKPVPEFKDSSITVPYNTSLSLPACAAAQTVDWYQDGKLICANCPTLKIDEAKYFNTTYHCVVSNGDCHDSCTYSISVIDIPHDIWLPDAFTPNGDGRNDIFHIITDNPNVRVINLSVYNRWGQRVFVSNLNNGGWDGTFNDKVCDLGTYYWMIQYEILGTNEVYFKKGDVSLIR